MGVADDFGFGLIHLTAQIKAAKRKNPFKRHIDKTVNGVLHNTIETLGLLAKINFAFLRSARLLLENWEFIVV